MSSLLETYLLQVDAHLTALPVKRRSEELREIRQHLLNAATINKELGQPEEDAAANAVLQFGPAEDLGRNLVWAWKRERERNRRRLFGSAACTFAVLILVAMEVFPLAQKIAFYTPGLLRRDGLSLQWIELILWIAGSASAGLASGAIFSKQAPFGTIIGLGAYFTVCTTSYVFWILQPVHLNQLAPISPIVLILRFLIPLVIEGSLALLTAWLVSRLQTSVAKPTRSAQA